MNINTIQTVIHLATTISVNDLLQRPPEMPIPLKFMIQTRQPRASNPDTHYASALFRYEKEFAVKFRKITNLIFLDDKHREPEFPDDLDK